MSCITRSSPLYHHLKGTGISTWGWRNGCTRVHSNLCGSSWWCWDPAALSGWGWVEGCRAAKRRKALPRSQGCDGQLAAEKKIMYFPFALLVLTQLYLAEKHPSSHSHTLPTPAQRWAAKPGQEGRAVHSMWRHQQSLKSTRLLSAGVKHGPWRGESSPGAQNPSLVGLKVPL